MKLITACIAIFLFSAPAYTQSQGTPAQNARRLISGAGVPNAPCSPGPPWTSFYLRTTTDVLYYCSATNTWSVFSAAGASGDVSAGAVLTDNAVVRGDGGAKGVQTSGIIISDSNGLNCSTDGGCDIGNGLADFRDLSLKRNLILRGATSGSVTIGATGTGGGLTVGTGPTTLTDAAGGVLPAALNAGIDAAKIADGSVTDAEFQRVDFTSSGQDQLDLKAPLASPTFTGTVTIPTPFTLGAVSVLPTGTELNFVDGVTSAIQTQLDGKQGTLTNSAGLRGALDDESGTGVALFDGATTPTFTSPRIVTDISDANGNEVFKITATGSAVNELTVANAAASGEPSISATGSDTDIDVTVTPKGAGLLNVTAGGVRVPANHPNGLSYDSTTLIYGGGAQVTFYLTSINALRVDGSGVRTGADKQFAFTAETSAAASPDTGLARLSAGVIKATDGSSGNGFFSAGGYRTAANCADSAGAAACGAAAAGAVVIDAAATSVVVSTTAVTATSRIQITFDSSLGTELGITCNTTPVLPTVSARTAATSFTITVGVAPITNAACFNYSIIN